MLDAPVKEDQESGPENDDELHVELITKYRRRVYFSFDTVSFFKCKAHFDALCIWCRDIWRQDFQAVGVEKAKNDEKL